MPVGRITPSRGICPTWGATGAPAVGSQKSSCAAPDRDLRSCAVHTGVRPEASRSRLPCVRARTPPHARHWEVRLHASERRAMYACSRLAAIRSKVRRQLIQQCLLLLHLALASHVALNRAACPSSAAVSSAPGGLTSLGPGPAGGHPDIEIYRPPSQQSRWACRPAEPADPGAAGLGGCQCAPLPVASLSLPRRARRMPIRGRLRHIGPVCTMHALSGFLLRRPKDRFVPPGSGLIVTSARACKSISKKAVY